MVPETVMMRDEGLLSLKSTRLSDSLGPNSASLGTLPRPSKGAVEAAGKCPLEAKEAVEAAEKYLLEAKEAALPWC